MLEVSARRIDSKVAAEVCTDQPYIVELGYAKSCNGHPATYKKQKFYNIAISSLAKFLW